MPEQVNAQNELNIKDIWERLIILGYYADEATLKSAHPTGTVGDCYKVGDDLYTWDGSKWVDIGRIKGEDGSEATDYVVAESLAQNGYVKYASGFTIQWGYTNSTTATYPIPFTVSQRSILVTPGNNTLTSIPSWQTLEHTTTGFTVQWSDDTTPKFCWLALGR